MSDTDKKLAFEVSDPRGYSMKAWYLPQPNDGHAEIELFKGGEIVKKFQYESYKIWNLAAHFNEIVDSEIAKNDDGYRAAGSDLLGGAIMPQGVETP